MPAPAAFASDIPTRIAIASSARCLAAYAKNSLCADLHSLLADPGRLARCANVSYLHGNGFYKIVLAQNEIFKLRLHIWLPNVDAAENVHEHRWHFASTVLAGTLHSEIYAEDVTPSALEYDEYLYLAKDGASPSSRTYIGKTRLGCVSTSVRRVGEYYSMSPNTLHRVVSIEGGLTATLMCQGPAARRSNRLLTRPCEVPDVMQRYMNAADLSLVIRRLLNQIHRSS